MRKPHNMSQMITLSSMSAKPGEVTAPATPPVVWHRQSDEAYEAISQAIVRCDLTPGVIVSEAELASRPAVSIHIYSYQPDRHDDSIKRSFIRTDS
jgi:hypothetical protein